MRCLTIIMMNNLYPVKKLTTINNTRAIFLMELKEKTFIDMNSHIFDTIMDETRTHIYFTPSQHLMGYEVYLPTDLIGLDSKTARGEYVAIP